MAALFITLEGGDGAGKSVLARGLADRIARVEGDVVLTFEPGATPVGAAIREQLFAEDQQLSHWAETFLFLADRAAHVSEVIRPALARGAAVLCDRYMDSTLAYQGFGRKLDLGLIEQMNRHASAGLTPHLTLLLDVPVAQGLQRARTARRDRIGREPPEFHRRVAEGFKRIALEAPDRVCILDAVRPEADVLEAAWAVLEPRLRRSGYRSR